MKTVLTEEEFDEQYALLKDTIRNATLSGVCCWLRQFEKLVVAKVIERQHEQED